jgi:hypothetical protein
MIFNNTYIDTDPKSAERLEGRSQSLKASL